MKNEWFYFLLLDIPATETITIAVEREEYLDAETNEESQSGSSRRSSIYDYEPMPPDVRSNADPELTAGLLLNESSDSQV